MFAVSMSGITLFGFVIKWYGILIAAGVLLGVVLASRREKALSLAPDTALNMALLGIPAAIIAARLYYVLFSWEEYAGHPADIFNIRQGGIAIYGAVLGGLLSTFLYARIRKVNFRALLDLGAPSLALGQAIGRWGNFLNQEAYGEVVSNSAFHWFPAAVLIDADGAWHMATFFYESAWCFVIVAALLIGEKKRAFRKSGDIFYWYAFLYALERGIVEGFRMDSLYWGTIRVSQLLSFCVAAAVIIVFFLRSKAWKAALPAFLFSAAAAAAALLSHPLMAIALSFAAIAMTILLYKHGAFAPEVQENA